MKRSILSLVLVLACCSLLVAACGDDDDDDGDGAGVGGDADAEGGGDGGGDVETGTLIFTMNGEDFAREGFTSKDGWAISFDNLYINIEGPTAFQVVDPEAANRIKPEGPRAHAGHPHADIPEGAANEALIAAFFVDVAQGAGPTEIGRIDDAPIGNYNRLNFNIKKAGSESEGYKAEYDGYSIVMVGAATKDGNEVIFEILLTEEIEYTSCGPNELVGVVAAGGEGTAEATFHFDHVFGDIDGGADLNDEAVGFQPFADLAASTDGEGGLWTVMQSDLQDMSEYDKFRDALLTIGHSGEAHCHH